MHSQPFYFYKIHIKCTPCIYKATWKLGKYWKGFSSFVRTPWPSIYLTYTAVTMLLSSKLCCTHLKVFYLKNTHMSPKINYFRIQKDVGLHTLLLQTPYETWKPVHFPFRIKIFYLLVLTFNIKHVCQKIL